ncbi:MAG: helix-turn-helix domain-containing protein, partial [Clostridia bacterium]
MNLHDVDKIIEIICKIENCEVEMIKSDKRNSELVYCRGIIILILRELFDLNYRQIGLFISRNKSTTYKLYKRFELMC